MKGRAQRREGAGSEVCRGRIRGVKGQAQRYVWVQIPICQRPNTVSPAKVDMEDLGGVAPRRSARGKAGVASDTSCSGSVPPAGPPEMLTPLVRSSLTKQVWMDVHTTLDADLSGECHAYPTLSFVYTVHPLKPTLLDVLRGCETPLIPSLSPGIQAHWLPQRGQDVSVDQEHAEGQVRDGEEGKHILSIHTF